MKQGFAALAALVLAQAVAPGAALAETVYVRAGRLVDTEKGAVLPARLIRVDDGRVVSVTADGPVPQGAPWSTGRPIPCCPA
jgi:hypothetical protein